MVEKLITSEFFDRLHDDDAVSLCCTGILQFVLLGLEDRSGVPDWILRDANVRRWPSLYATEPRRDVDKKTYLIFGFTWAFKGRLPTERLTPDKNEARSDWWVLSWAYFDGRISEAEEYLVIEFHSMQGGPSSFPTQGNISFFEDAKRLFLMGLIWLRQTGKPLYIASCVRKRGPSMVRREDYIDCMEFLLNPYYVYLDCHMMSYMVPDYFWRQLVPHLCMAGSHSLERANQEGWLSGDVYMSINAGGNHWAFEEYPLDREDRGRQLAIMNLGHQFDNACIAKDELRKAYEECIDISMEQRALIENFLKIESELDYAMQNALFRKAEKLEKQIIDKNQWLQQL
ncbi:hypothetical protein Tco_0829297 [Tanacetum coccineum]